MNYGLILAGGLGLRMGQSVDLPKQFFRLADKPVLIHTLEIFDQHPLIDAVVVVYLPTWEHYLRDCLNQFHIRKAKWLVPGGKVRQESVFHGLCELEKHCSSQDIVLVHDGVRPFITEDLITKNIQLAGERGNAMTAVRCTDTLIAASDGRTSREAMVRDHTFSVQTPQTYPLGYGLNLYRQAYEAGRENTINCCELFIEFGQKVHIVQGGKNNMKLTTEEDIAFLKALHEIYRQERTEAGEPAPVVKLVK